MRKWLTLGFIGTSFIMGCTEDPGMTMQFKDKAETLMVGQLNMRDVNYINKVYFDYEVSDGQTTCSGKTPTVKLQLTSTMRNKANTTMSVSCDDGRNGKLAANMSFNGTWSGVGVGTLNDGTKVRVVVGDMMGNLDW